MTWHLSTITAEVHPTIKWLARTGPDSPWLFVTSPGPKHPRLCAVKGCRHVLLPSGTGKACARCKRLRWRVNYPLRAQFSNLKDSARRKRILFDLTFEQFAAFAVASGYAEKSGRFLGCLHVDREDPLQGYHVGNIRALEAGDNSRKGATEDRKAHWLAARRGVPVMVERAVTPVVDENDVGF